MRLGWRVWNWLGSIAFLLGVGALLWATRGPGGPILLAMVWVLCIPFLWFSESLGAWIGAPPMPGGAGSRPISKESPPFLVLGFAWLILFGTAAVLLFA